MYQFTAQEQAILSTFNKSQIYHDLRLRYETNGYQNIDNAAVALYLLLGSEKQNRIYQFSYPKIEESEWVEILVEKLVEALNNNCNDFIAKATTLELNIITQKQEQERLANLGKLESQRKIKAEIFRVSVVLRILDFAHGTKYRGLHKEELWCLPVIKPVDSEICLRDFLDNIMGNSSANASSYSYSIVKACETNMRSLCYHLFFLLNLFKMDRIRFNFKSSSQEKDNQDSDFSEVLVLAVDGDIDGDWENGAFNVDSDEISPVDSVYASISSNRVNELLAVLGALEEARQARPRKTIVKSRKESRWNLGNDPSLILPEEFAKSSIQFCMDFAEVKLLQKAPPPKATGKKGDAFVLFDVSGSMRNTLIERDITSTTDPAKICWAKGILIKIAEQIKGTKRWIHVIPFNSEVWNHQKIILDGSKSSFLELLALQQPTGTTDREKPVLHLFSQEIHALKRADILYITDDTDFKFSKSFLSQVQEIKRRLAFEIHVILIGDNPNRLAKKVRVDDSDLVFDTAKDAYLGTIADYVVELDALTTAASKLDQLLLDKYEN